MTKTSELNAVVHEQFGALLEPHGFQQVGLRRWVHDSNAPIRRLVEIRGVKGARYCPLWGISSEIVPSFRAGRFKRKRTNKSALRDITIDPIDRTGLVPSQAFRFFASSDAVIPTRAIADCARYFVPQAMSDLEQVCTMRDFCELYELRRKMTHRRFGFDQYIQHDLAEGFVMLLQGHREKGVSRIGEFCVRHDADPGCAILTEHMRRAEDYALDH